MNFTYPYLSQIITIDCMSIHTLVIENQRFLRELLTDIVMQCKGDNGRAVLSEGGEVLTISKHIEILSDFIDFDMNKKELINRISTKLEKEALSVDYYIQTQEILSVLEQYLNTLSFSFPCDIIPTRLGIAPLLKSMGLQLRCDNEDSLGNLLDYMELVREFDCEKLFLCVNMRAYYSDPEMELFLKTALSHEYQLLMVENMAHPMLSMEKRWTVDEDLCEF